MIFTAIYAAVDASQQSSWHTSPMVATRTTLPDLNTLDADALKSILLATHEELVSVQEQLRKHPVLAVLTGELSVHESICGHFR